MTIIASDFWMRPPLNPALCLILDPLICGGHKEALKVAQAAINGGVSMLQLRSKQMNKGPLLRLAQDLLPITRRHRVPLLMNDHCDLAIASDADGVHVGQTDLPPTVARQLVGDGAILGLSITSIEQVSQTNELGCIDYVGVGPVFPTQTKRDADPTIGLDGLNEICRRIKYPTIAIGGISIDNAADVMAQGVDGIAVISAICSLNNAEQIELTASRLRSAVDSNIKPRYEKETIGGRTYCKLRGERISYWRDVPLRTDRGNYNMVVEIPKDTIARNEVGL